jgi:hypothetical protein
MSKVIKEWEEERLKILNIKREYEEIGLMVLEDTERAIEMIERIDEEYALEEIREMKRGFEESRFETLRGLKEMRESVGKKIESIKK